MGETITVLPSPHGASRYAGKPVFKEVMMPHAKLRGVLVAAVTPFTDDLALDEADLRQHVTRVAAVPGVTGIVCNAHAAEVETLDRDERRRCLALARESAPGKTIVAGIRASSTANAVA